MKVPRECPKCGHALPDVCSGYCPRCQVEVLPPLPDLELGNAPPAVRLDDLPPPPGPLKPVLLSSERTAGTPSAAAPAQPGWRRCPHCQARVHADDPHCFLCGKSIAQPASTVEPRPTRRDFELHRGGLIGNLARVSLVAGGLSFLGIAFIPLAALSVLAAAAGTGAVVMARDDLELMERQVMDPAGRSETLRGQGRAATGIVLGLAGALLSLLVHVPTLLA